MEYIIDDGKTVICPECYAYLRLPEPVKENQTVLCHACRVKIQIVNKAGKLDAVVIAPKKGEEDKSW
jgi:uncharacterized paraquat-inducible protein A